MAVIEQEGVGDKVYCLTYTPYMYGELDVVVTSFYDWHLQIQSPVSLLRYIALGLCSPVSLPLLPQQALASGCTLT